MERLSPQGEGSVLSATLMITGCCVGAGMIGLPVVSALAGFVPSFLALLLCAVFAISTGLLILEATLWFEKKVNFISMAGFALGIWGKSVTWLLFLFLFYCLFVAYIDGAGQLLVEGIFSFFHKTIPLAAGKIGAALCVGAIAYGGMRVVSRMSGCFLLAAAISFCGLLSLGIGAIDLNYLKHAQWQAVLPTLPIILVCFGYQNLVPSLTYYLHKNVSKMRMAIVFGNLVPLTIYAIWNFVILGMIPSSDPETLATMVHQSNMVPSLLEHAAQSPSVLFLAKTFSLLTIITPFIANTLAFADFLRDGLKMPQGNLYNVLLFLLVLAPPTLLTLCYPHLFLKALALAGGFADILLLGVLPILIVAIGRYKKKIKGPFTVFGGQLFLFMVFLLCVGFLTIGPLATLITG